MENSGPLGEPLLLLPLREDEEVKGFMFLQAEAIDQALTFVNTLGSSTTCGNDEHIVARYCMAL